MEGSFFLLHSTLYPKKHVLLSSRPMTNRSDLYQYFSADILFGTEVNEQILIDFIIIDYTPKAGSTPE